MWRGVEKGSSDTWVRGETVVRVATIVTLASLVLLASVWAGSAFAGSSSVSGYGGQGGSVEQQVEGGAAVGAGGGAVESGSSALPFTGLDLGLLIGGGLLLLAVGAGLRRLARDKA
jgi:hypothetical protein